MCPPGGDGTTETGLALQVRGVHVNIWSGTKSLLLGNRAGPRSRPSRSGLLRRPLVALVALAAAGTLAAGCGNNSGSGSGATGSGGYGSSGAAPTSNPPSGVATVTATSTQLGMILVDGSGRTLYLFEKDQPNQSACSGACVAAWPVDQSSGTPKAGSGVKASLLGTISRSDGTTQVTYNHHPLYYYSGDSGAGQQNGQGVDAFGAAWFVVAPTGAKVG
jgi:predicted lipoprotein with Yx(FWY)xxD motif